MNTALITGGLGFVGSYIAKDLIEQKTVDKVICLDNFASYVDVTNPDYQDYRKSRFEGILENVIIERGDAKFYGVINNVIEKYRPKYIFHLASLPLAKIDNLNVQEAFESSVTATSNIIEICSTIKDYNLDRFIYTSSSMVYGNFSEEEVSEEAVEEVVAEEETGEAQEKVCPVCSANTPADAITCASCGWTFES